MQEGKNLSVSHHFLIRAIVEKELIRQGLGTWDDFVKRNPMEPQMGGPRGQGMGTREKTTIGVRKVVYKIVQEASASTSSPEVTKKRTPLSKASTSKRQKLPIETIEKDSEEMTPVL